MIVIFVNSLQRAKEWVLWGVISSIAQIKAPNKRYDLSPVVRCISIYYHTFLMMSVDCSSFLMAKGKVNH